MNDNFEDPRELSNRWKKVMPNHGEPTEGEWNAIRATVLKAVREALAALNQFPSSDG
jgi:hypothetical protein